VAFTLLMPRANSLYFSSSSSRLASRIIGLASGATLVAFLMALPPQPQENAATVAQTIHVNTRIFNPAVLAYANEAI
jgi:hypothetical protein